MRNELRKSKSLRLPELTRNPETDLPHLSIRSPVECRASLAEIRPPQHHFRPTKQEYKRYLGKIKSKLLCNEKFNKVLLMSQNHLNLVLVNNFPLFSIYVMGHICLNYESFINYRLINLSLVVDPTKFFLAGANNMCPSLTSPGGILDEEVGEETIVAIMAEGKEHALAIGFTKSSEKDICKKDRH
ncbi:hypothetical protein LXL04_015956 [Taraxacum kok-saghyz]